MNDEYEVEPMYRVYENNSGRCLEFRVCPDFPGNILFNTPDEESSEYYGYIRLSLTMDHAKKLYEALGRQIKAMEDL